MQSAMDKGAMNPFMPMKNLLEQIQSYIWKKNLVIL